MPFSEDISAFFRSTDFASVATWGASSANVLLDMPTEDVLGGKANSNEYEATLAATDFPNITRGASVTIATVAYTVREVKLIDDGAVKRLTLTKT